MTTQLQTADGLIVFQPSADGSATLRVDASQRAATRVNRLLFGKFSEHLGQNIYNGMSAQVLQNSTFADWSFYRYLRDGADRRRGQGFPIDDVLAAYEQGTAPFWIPVGSPGCLVDWESPVHGETCQRVVTNTNGGGVKQAIWLPVHRVREYAFSVQLRGTAPGIRVSLGVPGDADEICGADLGDLATDEWRDLSADLTLPNGTPAPGEIVELRVTSSGEGRFWLDLAFLLPADHVGGCDPDVIRLLKESRLPLLRFPGGNFVSGYHWRDCVGPIGDRPMLKNPAWPTPEPNFIGTDEHVAFCRAVGCEPMVCVNAGNGTPREAAEWVEYCNGGTDTEMGKLRAANGHPEPYGIRFWEVGNEIYGGWQVGHCTPEEYAARYDAFRTAMLAVDPSIQLIANGQSTQWNGPLVERAGERIRSLSVHSLVGGAAGRIAPEEIDADAVYRALMASTTGYDAHLMEMAEQAQPHVSSPRFAVTELQVFTNVPHLPNNNSMSEALFLAGTVHSALRLGDIVEMITHSALVNHGGGLRKQKEQVYANPVHWVHHLYGNLPDGRLVQSTASGPTFDADLEAIGSWEAAPVLDHAAMVSDAGDELLLLLVNRDPEDTLPVQVSIEGFTPAANAEVSTVAGDSYMAKNDLEHPDAVAVETETIPVSSPDFALTLGPHSVNVVHIPGESG